jgi:hypothetical protein
MNRHFGRMLPNIRWIGRERRQLLLSVGWSVGSLASNFGYFIRDLALDFGKKCFDKVKGVDQ